MSYSLHSTSSSTDPCPLVSNDPQCFLDLNTTSTTNTNKNSSRARTNEIGKKVDLKKKILIQKGRPANYSTSGLRLREEQRQGDGEV